MTINPRAIGNVLICCFVGAILIVAHIAFTIGSRIRGSSNVVTRQTVPTPKEDTKKPEAAFR